jgi:cytochrome P450
MYIAQLTPILLEEISYGFEKDLAAAKSTPKGKQVTAMKFFSSVVHRSATRVMIGTELCRDEKFLKETTSMLESIFLTAIIIVNLPLGPFRPALARLLILPHKWKLDKCAKRLEPVLLQRIKNRKSESIGSTDDIGDAIEWTLDLVKDDPKYDTPDKLTHELLHNLWAASSAPGGMMSEVVYQILTYPEYMEPLREEAENAVKEHGWTERMLARLHLQDSFIREVNRLLPTGSSMWPFVLPIIEMYEETD